jgi:hypothetical protein
VPALEYRQLTPPKEGDMLMTAMIPKAILIVFLFGGVLLLDQGRRMKSSSQKRKHVIIVPGGLLATRPHADPV